jgi:hypothetical protein
VSALDDAAVEDMAAVLAEMREALSRISGVRLVFTFAFSMKGTRYGIAVEVEGVTPRSKWRQVGLTIYGEVGEGHASVLRNIMGMMEAQS